MIGLGNWACDVNSLFFSGEAKFKISEVDGSYAFDLSVPGVEIPDVTVKEFKEDGNSATATLQTSLLPGKDVEFQATFEENSFEGSLRIPYLGKIKLKNGRRITE